MILNAGSLVNEYCNCIEIRTEVAILREHDKQTSFRANLTYSNATQAFEVEDPDGTGYISRTALYQLMIENGSEPLTKEDVDEMMEDCGSGDRFKYRGWRTCVDVTIYMYMAWSVLL